MFMMMMMNFPLCVFPVQNGFPQKTQKFHDNIEFLACLIHFHFSIWNNNNSWTCFILHSVCVWSLHYGSDNIGNM